MLTKFNEQTQKVIVIAESIAFDLGHSSVGSEHLLLSILKTNDFKLKKILEEYGITYNIIKEDVVRLFESSKEQPFYMEYSDVVKEILDKAVNIVRTKQLAKVNLSILCVALLETKNSVAIELLYKYDVDINEIIFLLKDDNELESKLDKISSLNNISKKIDNKECKIIGRENEINNICEILLKKEKSNVLIIGEAGVGKSALIEKLAYKINKKEVPKKLEKVKIYELSLAGIVSGTKYRGEFEEKLKKVIDHVRGVKNIVLFIDEIHNLIGAGGAEGAIDAANILKPYIARKDITIIGATTKEEYYKYFEKDQAMNRRFSVVELKENTKDETANILSNIKAFYEAFHSVSISNDTINYLINAVDDNIKTRTYPDKAIDILDLSCVKASFNGSEVVDNKIVDLVIRNYVNANEEMDDCELLSSVINNKIIGQKDVIKSCVDCMNNVKDKNLPKAVFLFIGQSSVGKTMLANELSTVMKKDMSVLNMKEFKDSTSIQKLLGSPPGYSGYGTPSLLYSKLSNKPKSILLLEDMNFACNDIKSIFCKIFKDGFVEDNNSKKIYFNDTIIIMTVNNKSQAKIGFKRVENKTNLLNYFDDEFIDCMDKVLYFNTLSKVDIRQILNIKFNKKLSDDEIESVLENDPLSLRDLIKKGNDLYNNKILV